MMMMKKKSEIDALALAYALRSNRSNDKHFIVVAVHKSTQLEKMLKISLSHLFFFIYIFVSLYLAIQR